MLQRSFKAILNDERAGCPVFRAQFSGIHIDASVRRKKSSATAGLQKRAFVHPKLFHSFEARTYGRAVPDTH